MRAMLDPPHALLHAPLCPPPRPSLPSSALLHAPLCPSLTLSALLPLGQLFSGADQRSAMCMYTGYKQDPAKCEAAMRPSATFNALIDN